jgi:hypothetical protein
MEILNFNENFIHPECVKIRAKGVKKSYRFLHISDVHVAVAAANDSDDKKALALKQTKNWSFGGFTSNEAFEEMLKYVRCVHPNALLIAGDAVDYFGDANAAVMKDKLTELQEEGISTLYAYGNHEGASYTESIPDYRAYYHLYTDVMGDDPSFQVMDLGDLIIVAVEDSTRDITPSQLEKMKSVCNDAKERKISIILLMHIPICTEELAPGVLKIWGPSFMIGSLADDSPTVHEFCDLVRSEDTPIAAVLAGHIHYSQKGELSAGRMQYVSAPAFEGFVYDITVIGEE